EEPHEAASPPPAASAPSEASAVAASLPRASADAAPPVIEKGVKVRVLSGPFVDKVGVIGELDGRGGARVLLGLLSTRLETADLEPLVEGRERPALQSSHRRPFHEGAARGPKPRPGKAPPIAPAPRKAR